MKDLYRQYPNAFIFIVCFVGILLFPLVASELDACSFNDYVRITEIEYTAVVVDETPDDRGKVRITERITFDIHAASRDNGFWELWRDLPEEYVDGALVEYNVLSVKRLTVDGRDAYLELEQAKRLYDRDSDYISSSAGLGPDKWYHSKGPYDGEYNYECVLIYVDDLYREKTVYEIEYEMFNASMRYGDCSELYVSMFSGDGVNHLDKFSGNFLIPEDKMPKAGNYNAYTYGTNAHSFPLQESTQRIDETDYHSFQFTLDKSALSFKPYNSYIEFALVSFGEDKHKFTQFASGNYYYDDDVLQDILQAQADYEELPQLYQNIKLVMLGIMCAVAVIAILLAFYAKKFLQKKHQFFRATQEFDFYREIPEPLDVTLAGALAFCKHKLSDEVEGAFAAAMLSLTRKNYIEVDRINPEGSWEQANVQIRINPNFSDPSLMLEPLTPTEEAYFALIRRHAKEQVIALNRFRVAVEEDYGHAQSLLKSVNSIVKPAGMRAGLFQEPEYKKVKQSSQVKMIVLIVFGVIALLVNCASFMTRLDLAFGAFFILGAALIGAGVLQWAQTRDLVLLSQRGEDEYQKWRALYSFLNSETLINEREVPELAIWEEYLIYATAFGIADKVLKALEVKFPDYAKTSNSPVLCNPYFRSRVFFYSYTRSFHTSVRTAVHGSRSGSHGGGYGGGGRGGGGGGGGH